MEPTLHMVAREDLMVVLAWCLGSVGDWNSMTLFYCSSFVLFCILLLCHPYCDRHSYKDNTTLIVSLTSHPYSSPSSFLHIFQYHLLMYIIQNMRWTGIIRVDGTSYLFMGPSTNNLPMVKQTSAKVCPAER